VESHAITGAGTSARQQKVLKVLSGGKEGRDHAASTKNVCLSNVFSLPCDRKIISNFVEMNGIEPSAS